MQDCGIVHRFSCPFTHQQNGSIERKHRHIFEMGSTLMAEASLYMQYWGEAFAIAMQVINSLSTPLLNNQSLIEVLFHKKPPYDNFRVFGCSFFPFTRPFNKHKLDFRSTPCVDFRSTPCVFLVAMVLTTRGISVSHSLVKS